MPDKEAMEHTTEKRAPIETREASVAGVDISKREIEVIAVPYGGEATVEYRGELWTESFERGAFDGLEKRPNRIKAILHHDKTKVIGRAISFSPGRDEGLVSVLKIGKTKDGDETLALASEDMLDVSAGFAVPGSGQVLDRPNHRRKIHRAFLDHIALVADGAYEGARVLSVRNREERDPAKMSPLDTPRIDEVLAWLESRR